MLRKIFFVIACLLFTNIYLFAEEQIKSLECDVVAEYVSMGTVTGKLYLENGKSRYETSIPGNSSAKVINIYDGEKAYIYYPLQNIAMVGSLKKRDEAVSLPTDYKINSKYAGEETIEGELCDVYISNYAGSGDIKIWVSKKIGMPIKYSAQSVTMYYRNIKKNIPIDDNLFILPGGVQVQDLSAITSSSGDKAAIGFLKDILKEGQ